MAKKVCIAARIKEQAPLAAAILQDCSIIWLQDLDAAGRLAALSSADAVLAGPLTSELTPEEKKLLDSPLIVQTISAGVDQIDFSSLPAGIRLYSNTGGWAHAMAEHALALALACTRQLRPQTEALENGRFDTKAYTLRLLGQCRVLIVGWGGVGHAAAKLFALFGCTVSALGRTAPDDPLLCRGYDSAHLTEALADADIVILSVPDTKFTHGMINAETLAVMKEDAILINVARAGLIDHDALYAHLKSHPGFFAGLDVWWQERRLYPAQGDPLTKLPNVAATAHNSGLSPTAGAEAAESALKNIALVLAGQPARGRVKIEEYRREEKA